MAAPCLEIARDPATACDYTAKGNLVAVISNGTAVLGLGDLGALASKPVMEGKDVLFKRFADVDSIDLEVDTRDVDEFINCVRLLGPSFGGINLEDIKAPECFVIESRLREIMDIPVFHDDQHGTAIICAAGLINACDLTGRKMFELKLVLNGAGAAAISCLELANAAAVRRLGHAPRVALLSYSNFGNPPGVVAGIMRDAKQLLDRAANDGAVNFEFDGEMSVDVALDPERSKIYPFCKLTGPANILVMPGLHAANISTRLVQRFGAATTIGPILMGLDKPVQIVSMNATVSDLVQMALMAAHASAPKLL